jgi:hypothetical protein
MRQGPTTSIRWAAIAAAAVLATAAAACGSAAGPSPASSAEPRIAAGGERVTTSAQTQEPATDPAVAHWARAWRRKIEAPMERAAARLAASIDTALAGNSTAAYRLTRPLTALSNCRNPLEMGLARTPPDLAAARRRTLNACREIFVGTNQFVAGLNSLSTARANAGIGRIRHGVASLRRIARVVRRAAQPR